MNTYYSMGYNNTTLARVDSGIAMYSHYAQILNCKLNMCELVKIDLGRHDIVSRWSQDDLR
jgi:hypothetical protein